MFTRTDLYLAKNLLDWCQELILPDNMT